MKENPSNTSGSMAAMTDESTRDNRQGSLVNSGSKLLADFLPRCSRVSNTIFVHYYSGRSKKKKKSFLVIGTCTQHTQKFKAMTISQGNTPFLPAILLKSQTMNDEKTIII